ncbi:TetR/AcrR family transcriptional regulator [Streptomyces rectiverticillatus]|uniref:TetR/AcrR family transcriptional regulator n=1 Tax=Streptomyces rectiverticillatus TaxID=173860 RepID=UPI0015C3BEC9|nr:TetR/AcrR family transcriptional regulator [Streptomyces rectiverticillatus]QLE75280.1 TetR/AcrR family transcriptional regulator [Streptomyces rectiverticillatus]
MSRREELLSAAMRYVGEHGLATLTLRPLAAALGTSDRMLVYHFGSRERLVVALLDRAFADLAALRQGWQGGKPSDLVRVLWQAFTEPGVRAAHRLYLEAASLAGTDELWREHLMPPTSSYLRAAEQWLVEAGMPPAVAPSAARLASAALDGVLLQLGVDGDQAAATEAVELLARQLDHLTD